MTAPVGKKKPFPRWQWPLLWLALCLIIPSCGQVQKHLGLSGVIIYALAVVFLLLTGYCFVFPRLISKISRKQSLWLAGLTLIGLIAVFVIVYPLANAGIIGGGSDREDNINVAAQALLRGRYPYYEKGYLGCPTNVFPGSLLLAVPFVLLGNSAYQNFFWLAVFFLVAGVHLGDKRRSLLLIWTIFFLCPGFWHELLTGGDLIAHGIYMVVFVLFAVNASAAPKRSVGIKVLSAVLLGIGLSTRPNFLLLLPLIFSTFAQRSGWKKAVAYSSIAGVTFAVITVPFYLYDPRNFYAIASINRVTEFASILPFSGTLIPVAAGMFSLLLSFRRMKGVSVEFLRNSAWVQAFPVLAVIVLSSLRAGKPDFFRAEYGLNFLFFGALGLGVEIMKDRKT